MSKSTIILTAVIILLAVGHIEWLQLYKEQRAELERLSDVEIERDIYSSSLEQADETIYKLCQEKDELKARLEIKSISFELIVKYKL